MTWEQYVKRRYVLISEGTKILPSPAEIILKIITPNHVVREEEIVYEFCKRTKIERSSVDRNIGSALDKLVKKGRIVCVQPGYYRRK